jgi:hypothetical protein
MILQQILRNTQATLEIDRPPGPATGSVTVTITKADGTTLMSGTATLAGNTYTFTLPPQPELDRLSVTWSGTWGGVVQSVVTTAEIVGGYLFRVDTARQYGDQVLADTTKYPDDVIEAARAEITDLFEQVCDVAFVPRYARDVLDGSGGYAIRVFNRRCSRVIAATMDGVALTSSELADITVRPSGWLVRKSGAWNYSFTGRNITVAYEQGWPIVPADIALAGLVLCRYQLVSNDISDRMVAFDNDLGTVRLSVPGPGRPTGIPLVDDTLRRYDESALLLA